MQPRLAPPSTMQTRAQAKEKRPAKRNAPSPLPQKKEKLKRKQERERSISPAGPQEAHKRDVGGINDLHLLHYGSQVNGGAQPSHLLPDAGAAAPASGGATGSECGGSAASAAAAARAKMAWQGQVKKGQVAASSLCQDGTAGTGKEGAGSSEQLGGREELGAAAVAQRLGAASSRESKSRREGKAHAKQQARDLVL